MPLSYPTSAPKDVDFPTNVLVVATHGSARIPKWVQSLLHPEFTPRLQRNFSDFGTRLITKDIPHHQLLIPNFGRLAGDPNRKKEAADFIRLLDFGGNRIWRRRVEEDILKNPRYWREKLSRVSRTPYYQEIYEKIEHLASLPENKDKPIILVDVHDTSNQILEKRGKQTHERIDFEMPLVILSNGDGKTSSEEFINGSQQKIMDVMRVDDDEVWVNKVYKGGAVIQHFGSPENKRIQRLFEGRKGRLQAIQLEFRRDEYMNPLTQKPLIDTVSPLGNSITIMRKKVYEIVKRLGE